MTVFWGAKRLISVEDAARYLGVQKSTIYSWAWRRKIPSVKMGRRLLFDREDLDRMIEGDDHSVRTDFLNSLGVIRVYFSNSCSNVMVSTKPTS